MKLQVISQVLLVGGWVQDQIPHWYLLALLPFETAHLSG